MRIRCPACAVSHTRSHTQVPQKLSPEKVAAELKKLESLANKVLPPSLQLLHPQHFPAPSFLFLRPHPPLPLTKSGEP